MRSQVPGVIDVDAYLRRIEFEGVTQPSLSTLQALHYCHVQKVPFENLDVQNKVHIELQLDLLFHKIILKKRGGFCYELNYLFQFLLTELGFEVHLIAASVYDDELPGPEFDHMALLVTIDGRLWLTDVGFGDLFVTPLEVDRTHVQFDGRNYFKIDVHEPFMLLLMSSDGIVFEKKYRFNLKERCISDFHDPCEWKQTHADSYFVKNTVVTLPTEKGRKTIFNGRFRHKEAETKKDTLILDKNHFLEILKREFDITLR